MINCFTLLVHHVIVFEQVFANRVVVGFDILLCGLDAAAHHAALDPLTFFHAERFEDRLDPWAGEDPHQVIFERQIEPAAAGIALPAVLILNKTEEI